MKRTPEEERIFRALAQIETPEADLSAALRRTEEPRRIRPVRPLAAAAVLCALLTIGAAAVAAEPRVRARGDVSRVQSGISKNRSYEKDMDSGCCPADRVGYGCGTE